MTIPADLTDVENAIAAWVMGASGLDADHVQWADQGLPRPAGPWISLKVISDDSAGAWTDVEDAAEPQDGAEIRHVARELVRQVLSVQCFAGAALGVASAIALLRKVRGKIALPEAAEVLKDGGVGVGTVGPIRNVGAARAGAFEPRASMDVVIFLASEEEELGTYIEQAGADGTVIS